MKQYLVNEETMNLILSTLNKAPYQDTVAVVRNINENVKLILPPKTEESTTTESTGATDVGQQKAKKFDQEKPGLAYIPKDAMWEMGKAYAAGRKKYGDWNYKNGLEITRTLSAALRHIYQFLDGEDTDSETNSLHLGNAMANLGMAIDTLKNHPNKDDRFKK